MTNKEIVLVALYKYLIELNNKDEFHNDDTVVKLRKLIDYLSE